MYRHVNILIAVHQVVTDFYILFVYFKHFKNYCDVIFYDAVMSHFRFFVLNWLDPRSEHEHVECFVNTCIEAL